MTMDRHSGGPAHTPVITAEELLAKARAGTQEIHTISLRDLTIPVRVLSIDEINAIRRQAAMNSAMRQGDETDRNLETQKTVLRMATTVKVGGVPMLPEKLMNLFSMDELKYLYEEYLAIMDTVNPSLEFMSPEQFRALVDALKKNTISSKELSFRQLRAISIAYVDLLQRLDAQDSPPDS